MESNRVNKFVSALGKRQARDTERAASQPTQTAPAADTRAAARPAAQPFFDPQMLAKLGQLELIAQTVVLVFFLYVGTRAAMRFRPPTMVAN